MLSLLLLGSFLELGGLHLPDHLLKHGVPGDTLEMRVLTNQKRELRVLTNQRPVLPINQVLPPVCLPRDVPRRVPAPAHPAVNDLRCVDGEVIILRRNQPLQQPPTSVNGLEIFGSNRR